MGLVNISNIPEQQEDINAYENEVMDAITLAVMEGFLGSEDREYYQDIMDNKNHLNKAPEVLELGKNINFIIEQGLGDQLKLMVKNKDQNVNFNTWGNYYLEPIADKIVRAYLEDRGETTKVYLHNMKAEEKNDEDILPNIDNAY